MTGGQDRSHAPSKELLWSGAGGTLVSEWVRDSSWKGKPGAQDVALVVEVAGSSLRKDRGMIVVYGCAGIAVYWIVNLVDRQVEVYSGPQHDGYRAHDCYRSGQSVPVVLDGVMVGQIAVGDMLP